MNGMLSFLLFAGALQIDVKQLFEGRRAVLILSIVGVVLSTVITGYGLFWLPACLVSIFRCRGVSFLEPSSALPIRWR